VLAWTPQAIRSLGLSAGSGDPVVVSEVFGPTLQGEGRHVGRPATFVRTGGCNLACRWCDTAYTWDWRGVTSSGPFDPAVELVRVPAAWLAAEVGRSPTRLVVVTGGEPLLQARALASFLELLHGRDVHVETNGTLPPGPLEAHVHQWVVSSKLAHASASGRPTASTTHPRWRELCERGAPVDVKVVCRTREDVAAAVDTFVWAQERAALWVMPEGATVEALESVAPPVADAATELGVNYTDRLHVRLWEGRRGR
jgi:7-carboxy-7-deazaguanine synthase